MKLQEGSFIRQIARTYEKLIRRAAENMLLESPENTCLVNELLKAITPESFGE